MKLYYAHTLNPRKVCALARHLDAPVEFIHVDLGKGEHKTPEFLAINPNGLVPALTDGEQSVWESNAIMAHIAERMGSDLWPRDARQMDILRWLSWDAQHFSRYGGDLYFEYCIKTPFGLGAVDDGAVAQAQKYFRVYARVLDDHLRNRKYLVGDKLTIADFAVAIALPYADQAHIPLAEFANVKRWHDRLNELPAWREPFPPQAIAA